MDSKEIFAQEVQRVNAEHTDTLCGHNAWGFNPYRTNVENRVSS